MIAQVIVDIKARQTDRSFEYHIPDQLTGVELGSRVYVPFGHRKLQGFVVGLRERSDYSGPLKDLLLVVDEQAPLTPELVELSAYLAQRIFAYRISLLLTMLPQVMRANYRKVLLPVTTAAKRLPLFQGDPVEVDQITSPELLKAVRQLLKTGAARLEYVIENRAHEKTQYLYQLTQTRLVYEQRYETLPRNATVQRAVLQVLISDFAAFPKTQADLSAQGLSTAALAQGVKKGWLTRSEVEVYRNPLAQVTPPAPAKVRLTAEQTAALAAVTPTISQRQAKTFLLEGVTGSGKTEVYLHAISQALAAGRTALMLVPEISLTPQMVRQVKARFGEQVAVLHSALSQGEKYDEWRRIRRGEVRVVVGARSAIFAPLTNIGLIVIDEEHEASYKQEENPRYHAREVALWRSHYHHCPLILGSATPNLGSRARAQKGVYQLLSLTQRANQQALPAVDLIDLKTVRFAGDQFDLSQQLLDAIEVHLKRNEQVILLLNRRGFAHFMLCRECGFVLKCPNCDLSLTMHKDTQQMQCHYCGHTQPIPSHCPQCGSQQIRFLGTGTQKVAEELQALLPAVRLLRMDVDTTRRKGSYKRNLDAFGRGKADILLGNQMIAKGPDLPNVTLVGVIKADSWPVT